MQTLSSSTSCLVMAYSYKLVKILIQIHPPLSWTSILEKSTENSQIIYFPLHVSTLIVDIQKNFVSFHSKSYMHHN